MPVVFFWLCSFKITDDHEAAFLVLALINLLDTNLFVPYIAAGSINISSILTGKCLAKINPGNSRKQKDPCKQKKVWRFQNTVSEALEDITALYYDEDRDEIYTGNRHGLVHVWSN